LQSVFIIVSQSRRIVDEKEQEIMINIVNNPSYGDLDRIHWTSKQQVPVSIQGE